MYMARMDAASCKHSTKIAMVFEVVAGLYRRSLWIAGQQLEPQPLLPQPKQPKLD